MSGLGLDYGSSDEDETTETSKAEAHTTQLPASEPVDNVGKANNDTRKSQVSSGEDLATTQKSHVKTSHDITESISPNGNEIPITGQSSVQAGPGPPPEDRSSDPQSPYTASRLLIRDLTMPPIPNFNIPDSPPGSPPPGPTTKFSKFLELKKKGVHFNEKLQTSSALRNPGLLGKLMEFAGIGHEDQYASALPQKLAVPTSFPEWAYAVRLNKSQEKLTKKREADKAHAQREAVEFVPASSTSKASLTGGGRGSRASAAERVMAGLDQGQSQSPSTSDARTKPRSRSRSPRRKKSRFDR